MKSPPAIEIALLGAGAIGQVHAQTIARHLGRARLAAVVDPVAQRARAIVGDRHDIRVANDVSYVLGDDDIDAVIVATPTRLHAPLIIAAAQAGKHVFCEKPIALTLDEAQQAVATARSRQVKLQIGFQRRFDRAYVAAADQVARGDVGTIELLLSTTRDPTAPPPGYLEGCGGMFLDTAIHDFDSIRFLSASEIVEVYATASSLISPQRRGPFEIDTAITTLRLASGALATVTNSLRTGYGYEAGAEVFGSQGKLVITDRGDLGVQRFGAGRVTAAYPQTYQERFAQAYRDELADFVRLIVEDDQPRVSGEDAIRALEIAVAATRSQQEHRPISLEQS